MTDKESPILEAYNTLQTQEAMTTMARMVKAYYDGLLAEGLQPAYAFTLTQEMQQLLFKVAMGAK